jgi:hypothetical protein
METSEPQPFIAFSNIQFVTIKENNISLKRVWMPEADSKILLQKKGCFRE